MNYSDEMYREDLLVSNFVFKKKFISSKNYKDDLIQSSLIALYKGRFKFDETQGKYFTFAYKVSYFAMLEFLRKEKKQTNNFDNLSIDYEFEDNNTFLEMLGDEIDLEQNLNYEFLLKICYHIIDKNKSNIFKSIAELFINGSTCSKIASFLNKSRQFVSKYIEKFKNLIKEKLKEYDFELQTNICDKKVIQ